MTRHTPAEERLRQGDAYAAHVTAKADKELLRNCTLAVLLVLTAALLPAAYAAPAPATTQPVWIEPCGQKTVDSPASPHNLAKGTIRRILTNVRKYLNGAATAVSKEWGRVCSNYAELKDDTNSKDNEWLPWLPKNQYSHYRKEVREHNHPERLVEMLEMVHNGTQKYLATLVWLLGDSVNSELSHKDLKEREQFLSRTRVTLKSLQCGAQRAITDSRAPLRLHTMQIEHLVNVEPSGDTVEMLQRDGFFVRRLSSFLCEWQAVLRDEFRAFKNKPPGAAPKCPHKCRRQKKHKQGRRKQQKQPQVA